ncbi:MAG: class I SAM-dependent methyltransferase [Clostridia bacterium]|nr:class I SAM-dependent methyltransferase [Clostridia bacterium]
MNDASVVKQQYANANNLNIRISIHDKYSTNKQGFGNWIVSNYRIEQGFRVLELGCGTGSMWQNRDALIEKCSELVLTDLSEGMLTTAKSSVGNYGNVTFQVVDIQDIPYENEAFDIVIANMMLYHVPDIGKALSEVRRVLRKDGCFYCATYGEHGIMNYLSKILSVYSIQDKTNKAFTLQNGFEILNKTFAHVERLEYRDSLAVTDIDDMVAYIFSFADITSLDCVPKEEIKAELIKHTLNGVLDVPKEYGMFISS